MIIENWKDIPGYVGYYQVSDLGRVKSLARWREDGLQFRQERILKGYVERYPKMELTKDGVKKKWYVHQLVAITFIGDYRDDGLQVAHNDGDKLNNRLDNLRWSTPKDNIADKVKHGTANQGERHGRSRFTEKDIRAMRMLRDELGMTITYIADLYKTTTSHAAGIVNRKKWAHIQ